MRRTIWPLAILLATLVCSACTHQRPQDDLYRALGEGQGIERIVDAFIVRLAEHDAVAATFVDTDIAEFRRLLIEQLCAEAGGPCVYSGRSMAEAHAGLDIGPAEFNALVAALISGMHDAGVPVGAQNRLLARLAPMYGEVLGRSAGLSP